MSRIIKAAIGPWGWRHHSSQGIQQTAQAPTVNIVLEVSLNLQEKMHFHYMTKAGVSECLLLQRVFIVVDFVVRVKT